jgi:hypothetical protein
MMGVALSSPGDVHFALTEHPGVPSLAPEVPRAITHLWVFDAWRFRRVLLWSPDRGWLDASGNWAVP